MPTGGDLATFGATRTFVLWPGRSPRRSPTGRDLATFGATRTFSTSTPPEPGRPRPTGTPRRDPAWRASERRRWWHEHAQPAAKIGPWTHAEPPASCGARRPARRCGPTTRCGSATISSWRATPVRAGSARQALARSSCGRRRCGRAAALRRGRGAPVRTPPARAGSARCTHPPGGGDGRPGDLHAGGADPLPGVRFRTPGARKHLARPSCAACCDPPAGTCDDAAAVPVPAKQASAAGHLSRRPCARCMAAGAEL